MRVQEPATVHDWWQLMVDLYQQPGIAGHSLYCQQQMQLSVTVMLTVILLGAHGQGAIRPTPAAALAAETEAWQADVLRPLRRARDGIKRHLSGVGSSDTALVALRQEILEQELAAERLEQQVVLRHVGASGAMVPASDPLADAASGLARYLLARGCSPDLTARQALCMLLSAALPDYDGLHLTRVFDLALRIG